MTEPAQVTDERLLVMLQAAQSYPHVDDDWRDESVMKIKEIRYTTATPSWGFRLRFALQHLVYPLRSQRWERDLLGSGWKRGPISRVRSALHALERDRNIPDATLNHGSIICFWEEHADYVREMRPTEVAAALSELVNLRGLTIPSPVNHYSHVDLDELPE